MATTIAQLETRVARNEKNIASITTSFSRLTNEVMAKASTVDLQRQVALLTELINASNIVITQMEDKLSKVILPEETRYYLEDGEVASFQSNFNQLKAMMIQFDKLYKNLVAYQTKITS